MEYPKGTKFGNYFLTQTDGRWFIRRQVTLPDGTRQSPRYPRNKYSHLQSKEEFEQLINRLNYRKDQKAKDAIEIKTSFIPSALLEEFRAQLSLEIPNGKDFRYQYKTVLMRYFLNFFVNKLSLLDPNQWHQNQSKWGAALLGESDIEEHNVFGSSMSHKTITRSIQMGNRFMAFLHIKNPEEYRKFVFEPISRAALSNYKAQKKLDKKKSKKGLGQYILLEDWKVIQKHAPKDILPYINLMYHYGLRRTESLGYTDMESVKKGFLEIKKQLRDMNGPTYAPLKNRQERQTPHWFCKPKDAYLWISEGLSLKAHPDTFSLKVETLMKELVTKKKISNVYFTHDFRRTFVTNALRLYAPRDVQMAVGHASLSTTMAYAMDDRDLDSETFDPAS